MAAQSAAASVKAVPFPFRRECAVLYSTWLDLDAWSFRLRRGFQGFEREHRTESWPNRGACSTPWKHPIDKPPVFDDGNSVDQHEQNSLGILRGLFIRCFVDDAIGVEHGNVGVRPYANAPLVLEHRRPLFQSLRRHQRHFP